jgi:hypothetical protein
MITYGESLEHSEWLPKAEMLIEALPYLHRFAGARVVVKIGGELAGEPESLRNFAQDVSLLRAVGIKYHRVSRRWSSDLRGDEAERP